MTTTQPPSLPVLKDLAEEAGLDAKVLQLLVDHGITNSGTFFYTFQDPVAVKKLITPATVGEGVKLTSGTAVKLDDVQFMVALSVVAHMVDEIRVAKAKRDGALQSASTTPTAAAAVSTSAAKAPKVLPEGYWAEFLADFQSEKIGGIARQFPTHILSGADEILARLVHERITRSHTPLKLGEIVAHRQFTASGQINPFRIKEEPGSRMLLRDDGLFDRAPRHVPEPQKLQTFLDFLDSVKYGLLFARWSYPLMRGLGGSPTSFEITRRGIRRCASSICGAPGRCAWSSGKVSRSPPRTRPWCLRLMWQRHWHVTFLQILRGRATKAMGKAGSRRPRPKWRVTPASVQDPTALAQARLQVLRLQVKVSSRGRPSVACSPQVIASSGRHASSRMGRSSHPITRPTRHSRHPCTRWPRDSSERPRRQGRHPFFPVGGQLKQLLSLVP